jgi:hypothetical protein
VSRRAYETAVKDFMRFTGIRRPEEFRIVTRAHIIAWRDELAQRGLGGSTIRHRLASLASLFEYLCDKNAVTHNPVKGVERPKTESGEGKTPAIADHQERKLLDAPQDDKIRSKRDRAILSTLLFHALRREELCKLKVKDFRHVRKGVPHLKVSGKGGKTRICLCIQAPKASSTTTLMRPATGPTTPARCSGPFATTRPAGSIRRSRRTESISWSAPIPPRSGSRSARTLYARRPPRTRSITRPTSQRCRSGLGTPTLRRHASTTTAAPGPRTARRSKLLIDRDSRDRTRRKRTLQTAGLDVARARKA